MDGLPRIDLGNRIIMGETRLGEEGCMKKRRLITIVMIMTISVMLAACKSEKNGEENGTTTAYFEAVVEEVNDTVLLVDALESESNITGEITVPIDNSELYKVGDKIGVTFDGEIMESYPAQIRKPEKIEILSTDETKGDKGKVVALAMDADTWDSSNMEEALSILDSLEFNQEELSGAICEYSEESFIKSIHWRYQPRILRHPVRQLYLRELIHQLQMN